MTTNSYMCRQCRFEWQWMDGSDMTYMNWMVNEPTGLGNLCGLLRRSTSSNLFPEGIFWFDFLCDANNRFICKRKNISKHL